VWAQEHNFAFTVAKVLEADLLKDVQASLAGALEEGEPFDAWARNMRETFNQSGWASYGTPAQTPRGPVPLRVRAWLWV
jgi:hypothetical protein